MRLFLALAVSIANVDILLAAAAAATTAADAASATALNAARDSPTDIGVLSYDSGTSGSRPSCHDIAPGDGYLAERESAKARVRHPYFQLHPLPSSRTGPATALDRRSLPPSGADGTCRKIKVVAGDDCAKLASKCGLSGDDFMQINSGSKFCSALVPDQNICCSLGKLPDLVLKPQADGSCAVYKVAPDDSCAAVVARHSLNSTADLERYNEKTWGWNGCKLLMAGLNICLSLGTPPMPAPVPNAICGPTVPGTQRPSDRRNLTDLNPCPLNVCCNIWGQCGLGDDFCWATKSETGAPGTAKPGVQNCGSDILQSGPPEKAMRVGYFSAWNGNRPCLDMHADEIDTKKYTHIHFAFANITSDFNVDVSGVQDEFERFKKLSGVKRIISFGGWDFSTAPSTFHIIREGVKPANRGLLRDNVVAFVQKNDLDGFDMDWEYPGATDIPGVPPSGDPGDPREGINYLEFLNISKAALGEQKSVSIAAPASYWYLKAFPIKLMAKTLDYIVYMTYDLHGQWDYGNKWASPGCPSGDCLRSHVNFTETLQALSMITKAGVPSNKVVVGVTSYGRSFHMAEKGCDTDKCKFTGNSTRSDAKESMCTKTPGYLADAEIQEILNLDSSVKRKDGPSNSDIIVYDDLEWVSYMDNDTKAYREKVYDAFHFAGSSDWALDLQEFRELRDAGPFFDPPGDFEPCNYASAYDNLSEITASESKIPSHCKHLYILSALHKELEAALNKYTEILKNGYDHKYDAFSAALRETWEDELKDLIEHNTGDWYNCLGTKRDAGSKCNHRNISVSCSASRSTFLIPKNEADLLKHLEDKYGITADVLREHGPEKPCGQDSGSNCPCLNGMNMGAKELKPDWRPPNPKEAVARSLENMTRMGDFLDEAIMEISQAIYLDSPSETVDAVGMPILMIVAAVYAMRTIQEAGEKVEKEKEKQEEEKKKNIILLVLTAVFFVLPGLGEAVGAIAGVAAIARITTIISEMGGIGLAIHDIANNPENAPVEVFSIMMGGVAIRGASRGWISQAARVRREIDAVKIKNMGKIVSEGLGHIDAVTKVCRQK